MEGGRIRGDDAILRYGQLRKRGIDGRGGGVGGCRGHPQGRGYADI